MDWWPYWPTVNLKFGFILYVMNKDISVDIQSQILKFDVYVHEGHSERSVSHFFYLRIE